MKLFHSHMYKPNLVRKMLLMTIMSIEEIQKDAKYNDAVVLEIDLYRK